MAERNESRPQMVRVLVAACFVAVLAALTGCPGPLRAPAEPPELALGAAEQQRYARAERQLLAADPTARERAAVALLSMEHPAGLGAVVDAMKNAESPAVRASMVRAAAFLEDDRAFEAVLQAVEDPEPQVYEEAAAALARFTQPEQVEAISDYIRSPRSDAPRRRLLYDALGEGFAVSAVPVLIEGLQATDAASREAALAALRRIANRELPPDVDIWREWWEANHAKGREAVLEEHLRSVSEEVHSYETRLRDLESQHDELMRLVGRPDAETAESLVRALQSRHLVVRRYASFRLAGLVRDRPGVLSLGDRTVYMALRDALDDPDAAIRRNVIEAVAALEGDFKDNLVRKALQDEDPQVLVPAIGATSPTTGDEAVSRIERLLADWPDSQVRVAAAGALGTLGDPESVPVLLAALDDPEENVRWLAVEALRRLDAVQAIPRISTVLQRDASPRVRAIAASALGELGQPAGVPPLRQALQDTSERVRQRAAGALLQLAVDDYERMMIIADALQERGLLNESRQVLARVVEMFADDEGMAAGVAEARRELARIMRLQGDYAAAAGVYETLLQTTDAPDETRRSLVDSWLKAGQTDRVVEALQDWVAPGAEDALLDLALEVAEMFLQDGRREPAQQILQAIQEAGTEGLGAELRTRVQRLQTRLAP